MVVTSWSKARLAARVCDRVEPVNMETPDFSLLHVVGGCERVSAATRQRLGRATTIISFVSNGQDAWAENVGALAPSARRVFVLPRPPGGWAGHVCDWHIHQLAEQGLALPLAGRDGPRGGDPNGPVVVHPGSGGRSKCWPLERYEVLIDALRAGGRAVRVVVGEVELDTWSGELLDRWHRRYGAEALATLDQLYDALAAASLYVGNDSGPTHLAAQMGLPTVAMFGPTSATRWGPRGPAVTVLAPAAATAMTWLEPSVVVAACGRWG